VGDATYRAKDAIYSGVFSDWTVGDKRDGTIGLISDTIATHYDQVVECLLFSPLVYAEGLSIDELSVETISGFAPEDDATVAVSVTDRGLVYSNEYWELYGENYDYNKRFIVYRLTGDITDWIGFKFRAASRSRMNFAAFNIEAS